MTTTQSHRLGSAPVLIAVLTALAIWELVEDVVLRGAAPLLPSGTGGAALGPDLVSMWMRFLIVVIFLFGVGRIRPSSVGLERRALPAGLLAVAAIWGLAQIGVAILALLRDQNVMLHQAWRPAGWFPVIDLLSALFGEALFEELFWRGYLLMWFAERLAPRWSDPGLGRGLALVLSQALYGFYRLPGRLEDGLPP
ncbi:MAG TPA: CPBP family glutamic-type intramembrane protease, partial [Thermoanaerobaculia bacterium]|nr:CPBP family glutamic-type intramembrane protease [Thermoanaerobaculia bacterium]